MFACCHPASCHRFTHRLYLCFFTIHIDMPAFVIRNRQQHHTILIHLNMSVDVGAVVICHLQLFIRQLKQNRMGVRTIDEGGMDEGSGMNFSEYVAVLSGNTDLLEKARLEKKIAGLESERQAFVRGKSSSRSQLEHTLGEIEKLDDKIGRIEKDLEAFRSRAELNEDGSYRNRITLDGVESNDAQFIGKQLNHIAKTVDTGTGEKRIGSIYGFEIIVKSEKSMKEDFESIHNRFYVRGEGEYLYQYNYGNLAGDPRTAALNPLHALGTIEPTLEKFRKERASLEKDVPQLRQIIEGTWRKEADLAALKKEMERLDRQIQLALKPVGKDQDGEEAGEQQEQRQEKDARRETPAADDPQQHIPARLRQIADASGGRIIIGSVPPRTDDDFPSQKSNYKRESLAFYPCKAFPFHRLSVSRSACLFLIRTKRRQSDRVLDQSIGILVQKILARHDTVPQLPFRLPAGHSGDVAAAPGDPFAFGERIGFLLL